MKKFLFTSSSRAKDPTRVNSLSLQVGEELDITYSATLVGDIGFQTSYLY